MVLKDKIGNKLENGFYVASGSFTLGNSYDIYYIKLGIEENSFSVESWNGFLPIIDFREAAENFVPLKDPLVNWRFIGRKLEELSKK